MICDIYNINLVEFWFKRGEIICLSPKRYTAYDEENGSSKSGTKGVPGSCRLTLEDFRSKLYHDIPKTVDIRSLRTVQGQMSRTTQKRKALNDLYCKFRIDSDRITCRALMQDGKYM